VEIGGSLSGEHGIGTEKSETHVFAFSPTPIFALMRRVHDASIPMLA